MTDSRPSTVPPTCWVLASLRARLLQIDREMVCGSDPAAWLSRASALARAADPDRDHGARVGVLARRLALALGWPCERADRLRHAAELHDIGKHALPRSLLLHPGGLTPAEREHLVLHTRAAGWLLGGLRHPVLRLARTVATGHHERWDGLGYPARMVAVCDVWDALTHCRPYRAALPAAEAARAVRSMAGTELDPTLVPTFLRLVSSCPSTPAPAT